ncbi:bifunctional glutamate N-acetyltransferase/amino-acid acetyltransferase ArgJ [Bacillota bacterium Meth-B3]|nr:bifunctional glutamate N-acetyltransferase/amino-acid acetyltransferase ArgJ [Christensenellaceae bacterium]MEA5069217.1 bifunctional glutamate N-acetyltransferase/amino-acid acetyltransferase ArgJ [Christensenellaceae bacterium]
MNIEWIHGGVCAPKGFVAGGVHCGIRKNQTKKDLAVIVSEARCTAAAVYTRNKVFGAPITVTRENLENGFARAVICNSGNANTCNLGGVGHARAMCRLVSEAFGVPADEVIVASTGVIGQPLNLAPIEDGVRMLKGNLSTAGAADAAQAIMTTDLAVKEAAARVMIGGVPVVLGAIAKGSGMIRPNMATMLSFVTTDCAITTQMLQKALSLVVDDTYNMVSVDGDTSTNDMVSVMASGLAGNPVIDGPGEDFDAFCAALHQVAADMARRIAADGEGATKLIECRVKGAPDRPLARAVARSVVMSSLVKAAMFGADANWGRILCAIGYTEGDFRVDTIDVDISSPAGRIAVCRQGFGLAFDEAEAKGVLLEKEITIDIALNQGEAQATAYGCDLTYDYVKINGNYRT